MANALIVLGYVWSFSFILMAGYFLLRSNDSLDRMIGTTIFGNSFSMIFWITYFISSKISGQLLQVPTIAIIAIISILLFILYLGLIVILKLKPKKYYSGYSN